MRECPAHRLDQLEGSEETKRRRSRLYRRALVVVRAVEYERRYLWAQRRAVVCHDDLDLGVRLHRREDGLL